MAPYHSRCDWKHYQGHFLNKANMYDCGVLLQHVWCQCEERLKACGHHQRRRGDGLGETGQ